MIARVYEQDAMRECFSENRSDDEDTAITMNNSYTTIISQIKNKKGAYRLNLCRSSSPTPKCRKILFGKAFPYVILKKASLTVECALALPLFFFAMISMISFMDLYRTETVHLTNLCQLAKTTAAVTYTPAAGGIEDITLPDVYSFHPVGGLIPLKSIHRINFVKVRRWNGKVHESRPVQSEPERMVYVTETGTVFHRSLGCSHLNLSVTHISGAELATRRNKNGGKYYPCEICASSGIPAALVYVTAKGDRYHNSPGCSGLKRSVRMIKESEAAGLPPCSRCG